jgi:hypothetical protein
LKRAFIRFLKLFFACVLFLFLLIGFQIFSGWRCALQGQLRPPAPQPRERAALTSGIHGYSRPEDDAFLGYPEWYIVWSYQEKADFQEKSLPSGFPYFSAVRQYWNSYCCITRLVRGKYPYNGGGNLMLVVIGTSFSGEYIVKGLYEKSIGRLSEWSSGQQPVDEDAFAYKVAREYADFVHVRPFYEFHFAHQVKALWTETPFWGRHIFRKWERKAFLTLDYVFEAVYSWLIEKASHTTYGVEPADTYAWVDHASDSVLQQQPRIKKIRQVGPSSFIVDIPRYQEFTTIASTLTGQGVQFVEIAGNTQISFSVIAPASWRSLRSDAVPLFSGPVLIRPGFNRVVLACDVSSLQSVVVELHSENVYLEHIYDY